MFTEPRVNVIVSDEGFSIEVLGMTGIHYFEGNKKLFVDSEIVTGPAGLAIFKSSRFTPEVSK